jgi:hypothetical protein
MGGRGIVVLAVAALLFASPVAAFADDPPPGGGTVIDACKATADDGGGPGTLACRTAKQFAAGFAAGCRKPLAEAPDPSAPEACAAIDGRAVSEARMASYLDSWVHRALTLQRDLDDASPFLEQQLIHTHNSFNSSVYSPTLTNQDPNQVYSLTDQLRMDVRAIEIDLHWMPSPYGTPETGGYWVTLCHGNSQDQLGSERTIHIGCTADRPMQDGLDEVAAWLDDNPTEVVLLYIENQMNSDPAAHALAGQLIEEHLGLLVAPTPEGQDCAPMPVSTSRADILAAGHQVLIVGNCDAGAGTAWGRYVHERGPAWDEHGDPDGYGDSQCAQDRAARQAGKFRRYFEDSTWVAATAGSNPITSSLGGTSTITPEATALMVRCGANIIGLDQLTPDDPRLAALVWSWAVDEPASGGCAYQGADGRFRSDGCDRQRHAACVDGIGAWHVSTAAGPAASAADACAADGFRFAVPANGLRNQMLLEAKAPDVTEVWLDLVAAGDAWVRSARAGSTAASRSLGADAAIGAVQAAFVNTSRNSISASSLTVAGPPLGSSIP